MLGAIHVLPGNDLDLAVVPLLALGDVQVPHTVIDQLVPAPLYQGTCQPITIFHHGSGELEEILHSTLSVCTMQL